MTRRTRQDGIRTLADIKLRCRIDEVTRCWVWEFGQVNGAPRVWFGGKVTTAGRAVWLLKHGAPPPTGMVVVRTCGNPLCCNPAHMRLGSPGDVGAVTAQTGKLKGDPLRAMRARKAGLARAVRTPEFVAAVLADQRRYADIAASLGVSYSLVQKVKNGMGPATAAPCQASAFTWRPA